MLFKEILTGIHPPDPPTVVQCPSGKKFLYWVIQVLDGNKANPAPVANQKVKVRLDKWPGGKAPYAFQVRRPTTKEITTDKNGFFTFRFEEQASIELTPKEYGVMVSHEADVSGRKQTWAGVLLQYHKKTKETDKYVQYQSKTILRWERRDWLYNECLANDEEYSKPDAEKYFILWEATGKSIQINASDGIETDHPWLYKLFVIKKDDPAGPRVRFPWNAADNWVAKSISPETIMKCDGTKLVGTFDTCGVLRRWSSASRSCIGLVPSVVPAKIPTPLREWQWHKVQWTPENEDYHRFVAAAGGYLGQYCSSQGKQYLTDSSSRLYSIKTGVTFVGKKDESPNHKNLLESNSTLAMIRSNVVRSVGSGGDPTFRTQLELLTITGECDVEGKRVRDGFQVRDLTGIQAGEFYIPCHAIPYSEDAFFNRFDRSNPGPDVAFWNKNFARPMGRAKAKLFFLYGLIHASANCQNFLLAFDAANELKGLIIRDIGDTYWHDEYIEQVLGKNHPSFNLGLQKERQSTLRWLLREGDEDYPPPHLVRTAAWPLATHGFVEKLVEKRGWTWPNILALMQEILDAYRNYAIEAGIPFLGVPAAEQPDWGTVCPKATVERMGDLFRHGTRQLGYIQKKGIKIKDEVERNAELQKYLNFQPNMFIDGWSFPKLTPNHRWFLGLQHHIRSNSANWLQSDTRKMETIEWLINAEEMAMCAYLERQMFLNVDETRRKVKSLPKVVR